MVMGRRRCRTSKTCFCFLILAFNNTFSTARPRLRSRIRHRKLLPGGNQVIPDHYLIRFVDDHRKDVSEQAQSIQSACQNGARLKHIYHHTAGISLGNVSTDDLYIILDHPDVLFVEPDQLFMGQALSHPTDNRTWALDRLDGTENSRYSYDYTGEGVQVYILDSGIQFTHEEFIAENATHSRAVCGHNYRETEGCGDEWGHGTSIAALIGGNTFGAAKSAELIALKVLAHDGRARFRDVIAALDYVISEKHNNPDQPMVANLSLGTPRVARLLNEAIEATVAANVTVVVAAGNNNMNACDTSPASVRSSIAVGASTQNGTRLLTSNWGPCVDLYAYGDHIWSAWIGSDNATEWFQSGTSVASPFVTGVAALYLEADPTLLPHSVKQLLVSGARNTSNNDQGPSFAYAAWRNRTDTSRNHTCVSMNHTDAPNKTHPCTIGSAHTANETRTSNHLLVTSGELLFSEAPSSTPSQIPSIAPSSSPSGF